MQAKMSNSNIKQNIKNKILKQLHWDYLMKIMITYKIIDEKAKSYTKKTSYT